MTITIEPYSVSLLPAVERFNARMEERGVSSELRLPLDLTKVREGQLGEARFVAVQDGNVRGGFILQYQTFRVQQESLKVGFLRLPISEGIVDKSLTPVGAHLLRTAAVSSTPLFALGMGGLSTPFPRMLAALGWKTQLLPFYFKVQSARRVLQGVRTFRDTRLRRVLATIAGCTGIGDVTFKTLQTRQTVRKGLVEAECVSQLDDSADEIWHECLDKYSFIGLRDGLTLDRLYADNRFYKLQFRYPDGRGWAVVVETKHSSHKHFENLHVGTIVDCLSHPGREEHVIQGTTAFLEAKGVDLILSNQANVDWCGALRSAGFLKGPSNFGFASSPLLSRLIGNNCASMHLNRGDGDGPIHL